MALNPIPLTTDPSNADSPKGAIPVDLFGGGGGGGGFPPGGEDGQILVKSGDSGEWEDNPVTLYGYDSDSPGSIKIGFNTSLEGAQGVAIGQGSSASSPSGGVAIGASASVGISARDAVAFGTSARANHSDSVAIGSDSETSETDSVAVGSPGSKLRKISGLADGTADHHAVTVAQLNALIARVEALENA